MVQQSILHRRLPYHPQIFSPSPHPSKALPSWIYFVNSGSRKEFQALRHLQVKGTLLLGPDHTAKPQG